MQGYPLRYVEGHAVKGKTGPSSHRWKGGRWTHKSGYVYVYAPEHPAPNHDGYVYEHRMTYEESRGIQLPANVFVHHINGIKNDNRPENLMAFTRVRHKQVHQLANGVISLFLDDALLEAAKTYARQHGQLPDLEALIQKVHSP